MIWPFSRSSAPQAVRPAVPLYDCHSHLIPGLDDGASSATEAVAMLDGLARLGYEGLVTTPHFDDLAAIDFSTSRLAALVESLATIRGLRPPRLWAASEIPFGAFLEARDSFRDTPAFPGGRTFLIEFPLHRGAIPARTDEQIFRLAARGTTLVIAHPERCVDLQQDPGFLRRLRRSGALAQLDVMALIGRYGRSARDAALQLLEQGNIDLVSSDLHHLADLPQLEKALSVLAEWDAAEYVMLASENPRALCEGRPDDVVRAD